MDDIFLLSIFIDVRPHTLKPLEYLKWFFEDAEKTDLQVLVNRGKMYQNERQRKFLTEQGEILGYQAVERRGMSLMAPTMTVYLMIDDHDRVMMRVGT